MDVSRAQAITTRAWAAAAADARLRGDSLLFTQDVSPGDSRAGRCWETLSKLLLIHEEARHPLQQWEQMSITKEKDWQVGLHISTC